MIATIAVFAEKKIEKKFSNRDHKETTFQQS